MPVWQAATRSRTPSPPVRAAAVGDADDPAAELVRAPSRPRADVAEALEHDPRVLRAQIERGRGLAEEVDEPAARGGLAPVGALERDRLARDDGGRVAVEL